MSMVEGSVQSRRKNMLMRAVIERGGMEVEELAAELGVSSVTVYRDVSRLEAEGIVKLSRGTVMPSASSVSAMSSVMRSELEKREKDSFAPAVADIVGRGASVIMDDSSSVLPSVRLLAQNAPLTVVTNSLAVVHEIGRSANIDVQCVGGKYSGWSRSFYGTNTVKAIDGFHTDFCLMSDAAISGGYLLNPYDYVSETKRAMLRAADTAILLVDHTKFERSALFKTAPLSGFDYLITDIEPGRDIRELCEENQVEIIVTL